MSGCADAIASGVWGLLTPLAGDLFVRSLAERLAITVEEADALVAQEIRRRQRPLRPVVDASPQIGQLNEA